MSRTCCNCSSHPGSNVRFRGKQSFHTIRRRVKTYGSIKQNHLYCKWNHNESKRYSRATPLPTQRLRETSHYIPDLKAKALLSVSKLADTGYTMIFHPTNKGVTVHDNDDFKLTLNSPPLLQGWRQAGGLWTVPLVEEAKISPELDVAEQANNIYDLPSSSQVVRFLHAALGFPPKATLLAAIWKGNLATFPGLSVEDVNRHFPETDETQKGHMRQSRQGVRSTSRRKEN